MGFPLPLIFAVILRSGHAPTPPIRPIVPPSGPKIESLQPRETLELPPVATPAIRLPDEVVLRAIDPVRPAFMACFKRAVETELYDPPLKITLHIDLDATGKILGGTTAAATPALGNCLLRVGFGLTFGTPGRPASIDIPLFFR